jgi:Family of unknown function (DUF5715)
VKIRVQQALFVFGLILGLSIEALGIEQSPQRAHQASKRRTHLHRVKWNPVFRPSRESLLRQNEEIDRLALPRIHDDAQLRQLVASGDLVPIEESETLHIDKRLDPSRRYCRPWTRAFLDDLSEAYYQQFHSPIQVNSAVRTVVVQRKLRRHNRNAAPESGETASSHLAGITVDIQRRGMTRQQVQWVEQYLLPLQERGLLEPEEERRQWVFHVAVSGRYADWHEAKTLAGEPPLSPLSHPGQVEFLPQRVSDVRSFDQ